MTDLGTLGGPTSNAVAIDNRGRIVGSADTTTFSPSSPDVDFERAVVWQRGAIHDLGTLGGTRSYALAMHERGDTP